MKKVIDFLSDLYDNNNRDWFNDNKGRYLEVKAIFESFTEKLIEGIASFDPTVGDQTVKSSTYRFYRDIRFSKDKSPYKTHLGAYICRGGKCSGYAGYYFHIEPKGDVFGFDHQVRNNHLISAGLYMPDNKLLRSIREDIVYDGEIFERAIKQATSKGFIMDKSNSLKKLPVGYQAGSPYEDLLKLKDFNLFKPIEEKDLCADGPGGEANSFDKLLKTIVKDFSRTYELVKLLNRAIEFSKEN